MQLNQKIEIGEVISVLPSGDVKVKIKRHAQCAGCSHSGLCNPFGRDFMVVTAKNRQGAKIGDNVEVGFSIVNRKKAMVILYILPLLFFIVGAILGFYLDPLNNEDVSSSVGGIVLLVISFAIIYLYHKLLVKEQPTLIPTIIRIINQ